MAPEQAEGRVKDIGPWTDDLALGAILCELLAGRPPFTGGSTWDTLEQVRTRDPVAPRQLQPSCPRDLETICLRCLRKEVPGRYPTARALADDLGRFLAGEPIAARPVGGLTRAAKWSRRHPAAAALLAVCALAAAGAAAAVPWHIASLQGAVDDANARINELHQREREEAERLRRAAVRADCQTLLAQGQEARARPGPRNLQDARVLFARARDRIDDEALADPALAALKEDAAGRLAETERLLKGLDAADRARETARAFVVLRDDAFFQLHRDLVAGVDAASPEASAAAARKALALFGLDGVFSQDAAAPTLDAHDPAERERLVAGLYEVLLILAEATAKPRPGQAPADRQRHDREALAILERAAALAPDTQTVPRRRAHYLARLGEGAAAARERARAAALRPRGALDWFLAGYDAWFEEGDLSKALGAFDEALRRQPDLFWAQFLRALGYLKRGERSEARAGLTACARERPDFVWTYLLRGFLNGELGDPRAAEADFARAETLATDEFARYVLHNNRGVLALGRREPARAADEFRKATALRPNLYHAYVNLAKAYEEQNEPGRAAEQLDRAIRLEGRRAALYRARARHHRERRDDEAALGDLAEAIRLEPRGAAGDHLERGRILYRGGRYEEVLTACAAALAARPGGYPEAHHLRGEALLSQKRYREAAAAFDRALAAGRPDRNLFLRRALANGELGDYAALVDDYTRALAFGPDARLHVARGWAYLMNDAPRLAVRDFDAALALDRDTADAHNGRGLARAQLGQHREAVADAEEALRRGPRDSRQCYKAARVFAEAVRAVDADPAQKDLRGQQARGRYEERALGLLRDALDLWRPAAERGKFWRDTIARDPALKALHPSLGFRRLTEEFLNSSARWGK